MRRAGRRGRPPSVDRGQIERAVRGIRRREDVSVQCVAEALGVDSSTIYRHVGGAAELRRIHATHDRRRKGVWPSHEGETWQTWLTAIARYYRTRLTANPDLIDHTLIALDPNYDRLEDTTRILVEFGFEARAAAYAHAFVTSSVVGYVQQELHSREEQARGRHPLEHLMSALAEDRGNRLPILRKLDWGIKDFDSDAQFERLTAYLISGIENQLGAPRHRDGRSRARCD